MASKKNRKKSNLTSANPRNYSELYKDDKTVATKTPTAVEGSATSAVTSDSDKKSDNIDWKHDYAYVVKDLRQLLIVSAILFALVIGIGLMI